jgi:hypothetical protein
VSGVQRSPIGPSRAVGRDFLIQINGERSGRYVVSMRVGKAARSRKEMTHETDSESHDGPGHRNGRWRPDAVLRRLLAAAVLTVGLTGTLEPACRIHLNSDRSAAPRGRCCA